GIIGLANSISTQSQSTHERVKIIVDYQTNFALIFSANHPRSYFFKIRFKKSKLSKRYTNNYDANRPQQRHTKQIQNIPQERFFHTGGFQNHTSQITAKAASQCKDGQNQNQPW